MIVLNFSHPIPPNQQAQIQEQTGQLVERLINLPVQFDNQQDFVPQFESLINSLPLTPEELQTEQILVNLPSLNFISALLLAELHGRMGYFPPILRTRPIEGSLPPKYEIAEILNLQNQREQARRRRYD